LYTDTAIMKYPKYPVIAGDNAYVYEFFSEGPRGRIKKAIFYTYLGPGLYNLGFGDWNEERQDVDDANRSNNGDRDQVLATVAYTAIVFTDKFPEAQLIIEGSTAARTRLYQMGITYNLLEINGKFEVMGLIGEAWETFLPGKNYQAFLITRK